jgi:hypothetical protein
MYYHVHIYQKHNYHGIKTNFTKEELESRIVSPYQEGEPIVINGKTIQLNLIERIQIFKTILENPRKLTPSLQIKVTPFGHFKLTP